MLDSACRLLQNAQIQCVSGPDIIGRNLSPNFVEMRIGSSG
jgi:hypothetical protein